MYAAYQLHVDRSDRALAVVSSLATPMGTMDASWVVFAG
jgi:hypothetical protein